MVDRVTTSPGTDPRASSEGSLEIRLAALANALGRILRDLRDRVEAGERRVAERVNEIERRLVESVDAIERRVGEIPEITARTTADLRAVLRHLENLQQRISATPSGISDKVKQIEESVSSVPGAVAARVDEATEGIKRSVEEMPGVVAARVDEATEGMKRSFEALPGAFTQSLEPFRGLPKRIEEAMDSVDEMRNRVVALEGALNRIRDESDASLGGLRETVTQRFEDLSGRLAEEVAKLRQSLTDGSTAERLEGIEQRLENLGDRVVTPEEVALRAREGTQQALSSADIAEATRQATTAALATFADEQAKRSGDLEKALRRVDGLSDALSSLEKRRGARELLEGEQQLLERQKELVENVTENAKGLVSSVNETASHLAGRVLAIEGDINGILERLDERKLGEEIGVYIKDAVEQMRETLSHDLGMRVSQAIAAISKAAADRVAKDVGGKVENLREELSAEATRIGTEIFEGVAAQMSEEVAAMRAKIDAWGRARTAPKVAEELAAMDERIETVTQAVRKDLVEAVFERMQRAFDRRFEVLIQLVESRMHEALEKHAEPAPQPKRRFLRRSEEDD